LMSTNKRCRFQSVVAEHTPSVFQVLQESNALTAPLSLATLRLDSVAYGGTDIGPISGFQVPVSLLEVPP